MRVENGDEFVETLLEWYVENGRHDLPWRDSEASPVEILVAKLMLQQTLAEQVTGVYDEFVERYPTAGAVLAVEVADVAEAIELLGLRKRTGIRGFIIDPSENWTMSIPSFAIGIAGGTGAGKTTVSRTVAETVGEAVTRIPLDNYYQDLSHVP